MTGIVGIATSEGVVLAGDSAAVDSDHYLTIQSHPKVFHNGNYLMGYTTSFRMGQILEFANFPEPSDTEAATEESFRRFLIEKFVPHLSSLFKDQDWKREYERGERKGGNFIIAYHNYLFEIQDDFAVLNYTNGFLVVGCACSVSYGSLYSTHDTGMGARERALLALEAAEEFTTGVRGPFTLIDNFND